VTRIRCEIFCLPALDLRLGALGGAFLLKMSMLLGMQSRDDHRGAGLSHCLYNLPWNVVNASMLTDCRLYRYQYMSERPTRLWPIREVDRMETCHACGGAGKQAFPLARLARVATSVPSVPSVTLVTLVTLVTCLDGPNASRRRPSGDDDFLTRFPFSAGVGRALHRLVP
jgi:hypothetical protein